MSQICPKCQSKNIDDAKFCTSCGSEITQAISSEPLEPVIDDKPIEQPQVESPQKSQPEIKKSIPSQKIGLIVLVLLLLAGIGGYVWYSQQPSEYSLGDLEERSGVWYEKGSDDLAYGTEKIYHFDSGKSLWFESQFINGKLNGTRKKYYKSGVLDAEIPFVDGNINGTLNSYYESGALKEQTPYINGEINGIDKHYYESGNLAANIPYVNGEINGVIENFYESGNLWRTVPLENGLRHGMMHMYHGTGDLSMIITYSFDEPISGALFRNNKVDKVMDKSGVASMDKVIFYNEKNE